MHKTNNVRAKYMNKKNKANTKEKYIKNQKTNFIKNEQHLCKQKKKHTNLFRVLNNKMGKKIEEEKKLCHNKIKKY